MPRSGCESGYTAARPRRNPECRQALSGGQQKLLELGRLLMLDPEVIILDEPFAGVHPQLMKVIYRYIERSNTIPGEQSEHFDQYVPMVARPGVEPTRLFYAR